MQVLPTKNSFALGQLADTPASNYRKYKATIRGAHSREASLRSSEASTQKNQQFNTGATSLEDYKKGGNQYSNQQPKRLNTFK